MIYLITPFSKKDVSQVRASIEDFPCIELTETHSFLVKFPGPLEELSRRVGFGHKESLGNPKGPDDDSCMSGVVISATEIGGYADTDLWKWIAHHTDWQDTAARMITA